MHTLLLPEYSLGLSLKISFELRVSLHDIEIFRDPPPYLPLINEKNNTQV